MKLIDAYQKIIDLNVVVFQTRDIAAYLNVTISHASKILSRLASAGQIIRLTHGHWGFKDKIDILQLPELITAPYPSYISLQTALYYQGMISQIPAVIYAVSLARTQQYVTPLGTISTHYIQPVLFCGFEIMSESNIKIATPEKAIIDLLYLNPAKSRLFANLPEFEFTDEFDVNLAYEYIHLIPSERRRKMVLTLFQALYIKR